jgi:hypothetical protein
VVLVLVVLLVVVARHILVLPITLILGPSSYGSKFWVVTDLGFDDNGHPSQLLEAQKHA